MSSYEHAPLLSEAFHEFVQVRDPIFAAPPKSAWQLIKEAAKRACNESEGMSLKESWHYSWQTAAKHGFRRIKAAIYQHEFIRPLKTGEKKSVGHIIPRHEKSEFATIDRAIWHEGKINIPKSSVKADDVGYAGVRLPVEPPARADGPAPRSQGQEASAKTCPTRPQGKPGRPSVKHHVWKACEALRNQPEFNSGIRKKKARMVRESIKIDDARDQFLFTNLSDRALEEQIAEYFKQRPDIPNP
jgi:hypothetical protein